MRGADIGDDEVMSHEEYIKHVQETYKGIRRFLAMTRNIENGITSMLVYDLDRNPSRPIYYIGIHPRDILTAGITIPFSTFEEFETQTYPPGFIPANTSY